MPVLPNPKHERFVQGLLQGLSADAAYEAAGYKANRGNATRLKANESVVKRLEELQKTVTEKVVEAVKVDRQWVIETLLRNARICMGDEKVKLQKADKEGNIREITATMRDAAQANAALKLLGQIPEVGLFKEEGTGDVNVNVNNMAAPQATGEDHLADVARRYGAPPKLVIDNAKKASGP